MALEEVIVAWSRDRPAWQREVMRRWQPAQVLSNEDYDSWSKTSWRRRNVPAGQLRTRAPSKIAVRRPPGLPHGDREARTCKCSGVEGAAHLRAQGLTIVYGDNGSGKSGYARLLKRITRARHQEEVLTDVFRDTSLGEPTASLSVRIGDAEERLPGRSPRPELQRMLFYDRRMRQCLHRDGVGLPLPALGPLRHGRPH